MKRIRMFIVLSFFLFNLNAITVQAAMTDGISIIKSDFAQEYYASFLKEVSNELNSTEEISAGAFLDNEFNLHILLKADTSVVNYLKDQYGIRSTNSITSFNVYIEQVQYSESEITDAYQSVIDSELVQKGYLNEVSVNYKLNGIEIGYSSSIINAIELDLALKKVLGSFENFNLVENENFAHPTLKYNIYGGSKLETYSPDMCSLGFAATTSDGKVGFVTAGHCFPVGGIIRYHNLSPEQMDEIGFVTIRKDQTNVDAEFVQLYAGFVTPNAAKWSIYIREYTTYIKTKSQRPIQGSAISIYGYHDRYITVLTSNDAWVMGLFYYWDHMLKFPEVSEKGDSGGVIICNGLAVGILRGGSGNDYGTPADSIVTSLQLAY